jgi:hypothetical protein
MVAGLLALGVAGHTAAREPDLEGVWTSAWLTTLERSPAFKTLEVSEAEAEAYERGHPGTPEPVRGGAVGQEHTEWWDLGAKLGRIDGRARSSWIVDPPDGRLPYSPAGLAALQAAQAAGRRADDPETRPAPERCLMGLGGTSLPPMLNAAYNNHLRIVQTHEAVVLVTEMNTGPRIVPLTVPTPEPGLAWSGRSTGRWDGDTLVVETTGFQPGAQWRAPGRLFISSSGKVTERFRRTGPDTILYRFEVDDPAVFTRTWRGEMPLRRATAPMFEFACHEGNYSLSGILGGARAEESTAAPAK